MVKSNALKRVYQLQSINVHNDFGKTWILIYSNYYFCNVYLQSIINMTLKIDRNG